MDSPHMFSSVPKKKQMMCLFIQLEHSSDSVT